MWSTVVLALATVSGCLAGEQPSTEQVVVTDDLEYAGGLSLSVHAPSAPGPWPTVVLMHGAGLDRRDYEAFANRLAERGAVVFNADWNVLASSLQIGVEQIACVVRYAHLRGPDFGADPGRVVLVGHSTAALSVIGAVTRSEDGNDICDIDASEVPDALALLAPGQLPGWQWQVSSLSRGPGMRVAVVRGADDDLVNPWVSERMVEILGDAGYDVTLEVVPGGHYDLVMVGVGAPDGTRDGSTPDGNGADMTISIILDLVRPAVVRD